MLDQDIETIKEVTGEYCQSRFPGCFCKAGFPYSRQCVRCRDTRNDKRDDGSTTDWCSQGGFCWGSNEMDKVRAGRLEELLDMALKMMLRNRLEVRE